MLVPAAWTMIGLLDSGYTGFFGDRLILGSDRYLHNKGGPYVGIVLGIDLATVLLDNAEADTEAEPGSFPYLFGGEEGVEYTRKIPIRDTGSTVCKRHLEHLSPSPGLDHKPSSTVGLGHSLFSVGDDVDKDLMELIGVGQGYREV